jgi:hypothetical protein
MTVPFNVAVVLCEKAIPMAQNRVANANESRKPIALRDGWQVCFNMESPPLVAAEIKP